MVVSVNRVPQLGQYESSSGGALKLENRAPGVYNQLFNVRGNSILSTVFIESMDIGATLDVKYYDFSTGEPVGEKNFLNAHAQFTTPSTTADKLLVNRFTDKPYLEATVAGGNVKFSVYITVITDPLIDISAETFDDLVQSSKNVLITNLSCATANTEYSHVLQNNVKILQIQARSSLTQIQFSFVSGQSGSIYKTIPHGCEYEVIGLMFSSKTLYLQTNKNSQIVEITEFY